MEKKRMTEGRRRKIEGQIKRKTDRRGEKEEDRGKEK
jgi:hypothetical protein